MIRPNFFILGAPKCGTTSMSSWLSGHPEVFMSPQKEPQFFSSDIDPNRWRDLVNYERLYTDARPQHRAVGEASTWYLFSAVAIPRILDYSPEARFLVMVRNPLEMAPSLHQQQVLSGIENEPDFAIAWALQDERRRGRRVSGTCMDPKLLLYGDWCRLGEQVERLYSRVPRERVLVVTVDDLRRDPRAEYRRVLTFLGLPDDGRTDFDVANPAKANRSRVYAQFIAALQAIRRRLPIRRLGWRLIGKLDQPNRVVRPREAPAPEVLAELRDYFAEDVSRLGRLLGRDLSGWLR